MNSKMVASSFLQSLFFTSQFQTDVIMSDIVIRHSKDASHYNFKTMDSDLKNTDGETIDNLKVLTWNDLRGMGDPNHPPPSRKLKLPKVGFGLPPRQKKKKYFSYRKVSGSANARSMLCQCKIYMYVWALHIV